MKFPLLWIAATCFLFGCKADWTQYEKDKVHADCMLAAEKYGFSEPEKHCGCVLTRIMQRYPNPNELENMEMGEFGAIVQECQGKNIGTRIIWPEKTQMAFVDSCTTMATEQGKDNPKGYCNCVLQEIMKRYPTNDDLSTMSGKELKEMGKRCE